MMSSTLLLFHITSTTNPNIEKFNKNIEYVGYATVSWKRNHEKAKPYYYVVVILVDCKFAIDNWTYNNVDSILDEIVKKTLVCTGDLMNGIL